MSAQGRSRPPLQSQFVCQLILGHYASQLQRPRPLPSTDRTPVPPLPKPGPSYTIPFIVSFDESFTSVDTRYGVNDNDYHVPFRFTGKRSRCAILNQELKCLLPNPFIESREFRQRARSETGKELVTCLRHS